MKNLSLDNGRIEPEGAVLRGTRGWPPLGTLSFAPGRFLLQAVFFVAGRALTLVMGDHRKIQKRAAVCLLVNIVSSVPHKPISLK